MTRLYILIYIKMYVKENKIKLMINSAVIETRGGRQTYIERRYQGVR